MPGDEEKKKANKEKEDLEAANKDQNAKLPPSTPMGTTNTTKRFPKEENTETAVFVPTKRMPSEEWKLIVAAYNKLSNKPGNEEVSFANDEDAKKFFDTQAGEGRVFFAQKHFKGEAVDKFVIAYGDGQCRMGSLEEIENILKEDLKKTPGDMDKIQPYLDQIKEIRASSPKLFKPEEKQTTIADTRATMKELREGEKEPSPSEEKKSSPSFVK